MTGATTAPTLGRSPTGRASLSTANDIPTAEQKSAKQWHKNIAVLCTIMGAVFLFAGVTDAVDIIGAWQILPDPGELFSDIVMAIGGGGALLTGLRMNRTRKLEQLLDKVVGERDNIPLPELFAAAGVDAARGRAAVKSAIEHGYFGADAYIDNRTDTLVVRGAAPQPKKPAQAPTPKAHPAAEDEYAALLRQLREVNDAIPDPVMSQKISRLEEVSGRIFALAQKDPDKKAQLQKFMNYYLPTALKLLNTYASLSGQAVEGTNITEAKHSIERSMDLLVTAFENQLDKLFASDALDVSTDIAALEGMLNLDGLTGAAGDRGRIAAADLQHTGADRAEAHDCDFSHWKNPPILTLTRYMLCRGRVCPARGFPAIELFRQGCGRGIPRPYPAVTRLCGSPPRTAGGTGGSASRPPASASCRCGL